MSTDHQRHSELGDSDFFVVGILEFCQKIKQSKDDTCMQGLGVGPFLKVHRGPLCVLAMGKWCLEFGCQDSRTARGGEAQC